MAILDAEFEKVKYEMVQAAGSEYEFAFKYKKGKVTIQTVGEGRDELFAMSKAPREKKKKYCTPVWPFCHSEELVCLEGLPEFWPHSFK